MIFYHWKLKTFRYSIKYETENLITEINSEKQTAALFESWRYLLLRPTAAISFTSIVTRAVGQAVGVQFLSGARIFSLCVCIQTDVGLHPPSYPVCTGALSHRVKCWGMKLTTCLHLVPRLKMRETVPSLPQFTFIAWCFIEQWIWFYGMILS